MHDGGVEPGLHALVQEHAVEHVAGSGGEPEADVGEPEGGVDPRQLGLDAPDRLDRGHRVAAQVVVAGGQREGEGVEDQVGRFQAVALDRQVVDAAGDPELPLDVAGLALLVDQQADHRRAVGAGQGHDPVEARPGTFAVLQVGGVEHRPPPDPLQAGLEHGRLGGVQHQRHRGLGGEALGDLVHVGGAVAADVVDADVEHGGPFLHLVLGHLYAGVPVAGQHGLTELLGAVGVGALADHDQVGRRGSGGVVLGGGEDDGGVDRAQARLEGRGALGPGCGGDHLGELADVLRSGAAAAADHFDAELLDEPALVGDEVLGGQVVVHVAVDHRREPGVRQHGDGDARVLGEVPDVLAHLLGSRRAVDADHVGVHGVEGDQRGADLGARQHAAGQLDRDLGLDRDGAADLLHRGPAPVHGRLDAEQVELGLDQEQVDAPLEQAAGLFGDLVAKLGVADLAERREPGARPDRAGDEPGPLGSGVPVGDLAGQGCGHPVELDGAIAEPVLAERGPHAPERVGLDDLGAGLEVLGVHTGDQLRTGLDQDLGAALELRRAVVLHGQVLFLQPRPRGAVEDDDVVRDRGQVGGRGRARSSVSHRCNRCYLRPP